MRHLCQAVRIACSREPPPPGQRIDVGGYQLHFQVIGEDHGTRPTIVLDHSLGGLEGYLLIRRLAQIGQVMIYDRAGYGWSDHSPHPRTSSQIVDELHQILAIANIQPPYILVGDSFGSYNVRLYAHQYPEQVQGLILTDGLHEQDMLQMPWPLKVLKWVFISGFVMSILGAGLGFVRLLRDLRVFELIKPNLRSFSKPELAPIKRSFCRPKHWVTMARELWSLNESSEQLTIVKDLGAMPIVSLKSKSFFTPSLLTNLIPLRVINRLRNQIHQRLMNTSSDCTQIEASQSSHFIWTDQPDLIIDAIKLVSSKTFPAKSSHKAL